MTPGSMIHVGFADGSLRSIEGGSLAEVVAKLQKDGQLEAVREVDVTMLSGHVAVADILKAFGKLSKIELEGREEPDLSALAGSTTLRALAMRHAAASAPAAIAKLTQLESIELQEGEFTKLADWSALGHLQKLVLNGSPIASLAGLEKCPLAELELARTKVTDLAPIRSMIHLRLLRINETRIRDLSPVAGLTALQELWADRTPIANLAPLANLVALTTLEANHTAIADLAPLGKLPKLRDLGLSETRVKSLAPIRGMQSLAFLSLTKGAVPASEIAVFQKSAPDCRVNF
jgi:internalin A